MPYTGYRSITTRPGLKIFSKSSQKTRAGDLPRTSAVLAVADRRDARWPDADAAFRRLSEEGDQLLTHNYVVLEAASLLQRRIGLASAVRFLEQVNAFRVHWIDASDHAEAFALLKRRGRRQLSLTDCASFVVMRRYGVTRALAYDRDFEAEGFATYRAGTGDS